jgi:hypothetical protein
VEAEERLLEKRVEDLRSQVEALETEYNAKFRG